LCGSIRRHRGDLRPVARHRDRETRRSQAGRRSELTALLEDLALRLEVRRRIDVLRDHLLASDHVLVLVQPGAQHLQRGRLADLHRGQQQLAGQFVRWAGGELDPLPHLKRRTRADHEQR